MAKTRTPTRLDPGEISICLSSCPPGAIGIVTALRRVVRACAPAAAEAIRFNCIAYFIPNRHFGAIGGNVCMIEARPECVRLSFIHGAVLADPMSMLRGAGKHKRYIDIRSAADARSPALAAMIRKAAAWANRVPAKPRPRPARPRGSPSR